MIDRRAIHHPKDPPDVLTRLTLGLVAVCLAAGLGWLVQSAGDGHVHVTSKGVERHQHGYLGEHSHDAEGHVHVHDHDAESDHDPESEGAESESGFFTAAWVAQSALDLPTGLPSFAVVVEHTVSVSLTPPTRVDASRAQPRAPPDVTVPARHSRAV